MAKNDHSWGVTTGASEGKMTEENLWRLLNLIEQGNQAIPPCAKHSVSVPQILDL